MRTIIMRIRAIVITITIVIIIAVMILVLWVISPVLRDASLASRDLGVGLGRAADAVHPRGVIVVAPVAFLSDAYDGVTG